MSRIVIDLCPLLSRDFYKQIGPRLDAWLLVNCEKGSRLISKQSLSVAYCSLIDTKAVYCSFAGLRPVICNIVA